MRFQSGPHKGKEYAQVVLRQPDAVIFQLGKYPAGKPAQEFDRLISVFDAKPFTATCYGCKSRATRATSYANTPNLYFWCDDCDPYDHGALPGKLTVIKTFRQAVRTASETKGDQRLIIKNLAEAKGCPKKLTAAAAVAFLP